MKVICGLFGKTRQAYYKAKRAAEQLVLQQALIIKAVEEIRSSMPRVGTRKLKYLLESVLPQHGIQIGRDQLFDLLRDQGLLVRRPRKRKVITTHSDHPFKKYPNLTDSLELRGANQLWVSDITYVEVKEGFAYLSLITDAYSRKVVGFELHPTLSAQGPLLALHMALRESGWQQKGTLIHHSDRGLQYCCKAYTQLLEQAGVSISMSRKGDPYENALAERMNGILKSEFLLNRIFQSYEQAQQAVQRAIATYNSRWPHGSLYFLTPEQAHGTEGGILQKKWKSKPLEAKVF
ncbi:IS3 family transposase [Chitinophagaceae bacterium LB-8]|uniref:IS3 family transposase n=1 Tax=Paraflavisolibacter caeni TaxID=2982496 RepID=A0A9X2Y0V8_9BACT|nr:IS3 family transposase [Paraflavisolibacter caeni]MCU7552362.1 IS3 family transposase [Paraflavisolibacter caeni]